MLKQFKEVANALSKMWWYEAQQVDSRQAEGGNTIRRRRECEECHYRFTTYERVEERTLVVVKRMGHASNFLVIKFHRYISAQLKTACF